MKTNPRQGLLPLRFTAGQLGVPATGRGAGSQVTQLGLADGTATSLPSSGNSWTGSPARRRKGCDGGLDLPGVRKKSINAGTGGTGPPTRRRFDLDRGLTATGDKEA